MNTNKIYGTYTGFLEETAVNMVLHGTELELYFMINTLGEMIWRTNHDAADGRINITEKMQNELIEAQYAIEFAVLQTKRFGVEISGPINEEHVKRTDSYSKWFRWWNEYIQEKLSDEEFKKLDSLMSSNQDYSEFRPEGSWKE